MSSEHSQDVAPIASRWRLEAWPVAGQWAALAVLSLALILPLEWARLPAALFLGPMIAGIVMGTMESRVRVPPRLFVLAQAVIGCLMAQSIPASIFTEFVQEWPIYVIGIGSVIVVAAAIGIALTRLQVLPGTTAIWGSAPGASTAMIVMADAFGADTRLVAFMLYTRVVLVALAASIVARIVSPTGGAVVGPSWFGPIPVVPFIETIVLLAGSLLLSRIIKVAAGALLLPLVLGVLLQDTGLIQIELPPWLLALSYLAVGWTVGLRFTREIVRHAARALPMVLLSMLLLIGTCGLFALALVNLAGIDPLTAYLATSPGGADSVAIIASNAKVDVPFVMAMQTGRFIVVLLTGPALARFIATRSWFTER
jgi:membrane AbrB-like protein